MEKEVQDYVDKRIRATEERLQQKLHEALDSKLTDMRSLLSELRTQVDRLTSHIDSEQKLVAMKIDSLSDSIKKIAKIFEGNGKPAYETRLVLLEQDVSSLKKRDEKSGNFWVNSLVQVMPTLAALLIGGIFWLLYLAIKSGATP